MYCEKCGCEIVDDAKFCPNCGFGVKNNRHKNIYLALILTFFITGLGSVYAGNWKKGLILFILRVAFILMGSFISIFYIFTIIVWAYAFYEAYKDVKIANGISNPKLITEFKNLNQNKKIITLLIIAIILIIAISGSIGFLFVNTSDYSNSYYTSDDSSGSSYYSGVDSSSGSSHYSGVDSSSGSSHYSGVDNSPYTIAKNDPDWYYDHYEYGDYPDIDDYLESEGY